MCKSSDARIRRLFVDPLGLHHLLVLQTGSTAEVLHVDAAFRKPRLIAKLRGVAVSTVGWATRVQAGALRCAGRLWGRRCSRAGRRAG